MDRRSLSHLSDAELLRRMAVLEAQENAISSEFCDHFAEADLRGISDIHAEPPAREPVDPPAA